MRRKQGCAENFATVPPGNTPRGVYAAHEDLAERSDSAFNEGASNPREAQRAGRVSGFTFTSIEHGPTASQTVPCCSARHAPSDVR